jgi:hypothetical protein
VKQLVLVLSEDLTPHLQTTNNTEDKDKPIVHRDQYVVVDHRGSKRQMLKPQHIEHIQ